MRARAPSGSVQQPWNDQSPTVALCAGPVGVEEDVVVTEVAVAEETVVVMPVADPVDEIEEMVETDVVVERVLSSW